VASQVGVVTLRQYERGVSQPRRAILAALRRTLEEAGVRFVDRGGGPGVRLLEGGR
jgi:hypothetical protein